MAAQRKTKTDTNRGDFAERIRAARNQADLSLMNAAFAIRGVLPEPLWVSVDPIRRMEIGDTTEDKADPVLVSALAAIYGTTVAELSPVVAENLTKVQRLMGGDLDFAVSRCTQAWQPSLWVDPMHDLAA